MAVNHVIIGGKTELDLRGDSVAPGLLLSGTTAHNAAGQQIEGTYVPKTLTVVGNTLKLAPASVSGQSIIV